MKEPANYQWFVEPQGGYTNELLAKHLSATCDLEEVFSLLDNKGLEHKAYLVEHAFITEIKKSQVYSQLKFKIFVRAKNYGPVREFSFDDLPKKKDKAIAKIVAQAKEKKEAKSPEK